MTATPSISAPDARRIRRRARGFTLVELMISLVMGLIIAMAAVGLARTATATFYEQARISGVEAAVRAASERFRSDLSRVAFMSTPNIRRDPKVARDLGANYHVASLQDLQGIRIAPSTAIRSHALTSGNGLAPQEVTIAGNLTTNDVYRGIFYADSSPCGGDGGGAQVRLTATADPAVRRLFNGELDANAARIATEVAFMPDWRLTPPPAETYKHAVQVMDMRGCFHYLEICGVAEGSTTGTVILQLSGGQGLLSTAATGNDVCGARLNEEVAIAPIQQVRWSLGQETADALATGRYDPLLDGADGANKLNLQRQLMGISGTSLVPIGQPEIVAEYGVDLKLGLMVDNSTSATPSLADLDFEAEDSAFATWAGPIAAGAAANTGPQRIRSVRYRLAFRTAFADRTSDLPMPGGRPYISRYCMTGDTPCNTYARVRTVISEVALVNQAKAVY